MCQITVFLTEKPTTAKGLVLVRRQMTYPTGRSSFISFISASMALISSSWNPPRFFRDPSAVENSSRLRRTGHLFQIICSIWFRITCSQVSSCQLLDLFQARGFAWSVLKPLYMFFPFQWSSTMNWEHPQTKSVRVILSRCPPKIQQVLICWCFLFLFIFFLLVLFINLERLDRTKGLVLLRIASLWPSGGFLHAIDWTYKTLANFTGKFQDVWQEYPTLFWDVVSFKIHHWQ